MANDMNIQNANLKRENERSELQQQFFLTAKPLVVINYFCLKGGSLKVFMSMFM